MPYPGEDVASVLGLNGSYGVSLPSALAAMGDLSGRTVLDYGSGAGQTARALKDRGARRVFGVDTDAAAVKAAGRYPGVKYFHIDEELPFEDETLDGGLCVNVLCEIGSLDGIVAVAKEIGRVLVPGSALVVVVPNPQAVRADFVSYRFVDVTDPTSGTPIMCLIKSAEPVYVQNYFWTQQDYADALTKAGLDIDAVVLPLASKESGQWLDETSVAPHLVIRAVKPGADA
jgi:SAM-dependent methyltransferase